MKKYILNIKLICSAIFFFVGFSSNAFSQISSVINSQNDSIVKIEERYKRDDGAGEAIVIQRGRNDSLADSWLKEYIEVTRKKITNKLSKTKASGCSNLDFENGNFSSWICQIGMNYGYPAGGWSGTAPVVNRHTIVTGGVDAFGGFPRLAPGGGAFSVKLGSTATNYLSEQLIYTFTVQPQDTSFIYKYAVVFEDPNHPGVEQPYFELKIIDGNNNTIPCSFQHFIAGGSIPGFHNNGDVWYKPWTTVGVNLNSYVGQVVTVIVTAADCALGGHFGYGYIDFICPSSFSTNPTPHVYCEYITSAVLNVHDVDPGMSYHWSTGATTPTITFNPQLYDGTSINCYIEPPLSPGCGFWYVFPIVVMHLPQVTVTPVNQTLCYGQSTTLITGNVSGGTPPYTYLWNTGATTQNITVGAGTYTLFVSDASGCSPVSAGVTINAITLPMVANAGSNQILCATNPVVSLTGSVSGATGGLWSGGSGTFLPTNTSLIATYTPTTAEILAGQVNLTLTTTGNGTCPAGSDVINIVFATFQGTPVLTPTPVSCYGGNNGAVNASMVGGTAPFTYSWETTPPQTGQIISNLTTGNYIVTITDANGCSLVSSAQVLQPNPLTAIITSTDVSCFAGGNGTATTSAFGGTPGYSYQWSNGSTGITVTGLSANNYTVTVTDTKGCQTITSVTINSPLQLSASVNTHNDVSCNGGNNGSAIVTITGGTPGYSYNWSSSAGTSANASGLIAGNYYVTVVDANGCQTSTSILIDEPLAINVNTSATNVNCYGSSNGSASVVVTGGTPGYSYAWSPSGGNTSIANNLMAGVYTISITDSRGCQAVRIINVLQPPAISIILNGSSNVSCYGGNNGSANVSVSGGTPGYSYLWLPTGGSGPSALGLPYGNYIVSITDANNCHSQLPVSINQPLSPISLTFTQQNASCFGSNNGTITANPVGGTPPYTYSWNPSGATTATISNLIAGIYQVTIVDANQCTIAQSINITQPSGISLTTNFVQAMCNSSNGSATVVASGGTIPYSYLWSPGGGTTASINNIPSAAYTVTVTDISGCSQTAYVLVTDIAGPQVAMSSIQNVTCFGGHDGQATVTVTGGTPGYTYSWSPYGGTGSTAVNLGAGSYTVTVTDANGCQGVQVTSPPVTQPSAISIISHQVNVTCNGANNGSANLTVSGGTPGYSYLWSTGSVTSNISGLSPGINNVTVTDAHGCQDFSFVDIVEPLILSANISITHNVSCNGGSDGSATVNVTGGTLPFTYNWSPSNASSQTATGLPTGTHVIYVTDYNGCSASASVFLSQPSPLSIISGHTNTSCYGSADAMSWVLSAGGTPPHSYSWSPSGGTNDTATGLTAGTYFITVTDNNACQLYNIITISQPTAVVADIQNFSNVNCSGGNDGMITASVSGGTPGYSYVWSTFSTSPTITGLVNGTYSVTITDSKGCTGTDLVSITEPLNPLAVAVSSQNVSCNGVADGAATAIVSGGTSPYTYIWVPAGQIAQTANNLIAGTYTVSIVDNNGCQVSTNVVISQPPLLTSTVQVTQPVLCYSTNTGAASVVALGGTPPYLYTWSTTPIQTTSVAQNIYAGVLTVTVTDQNGCTRVVSTNMSEPLPLNAIITSNTNVSCHNGSNGIATASATGGTPPYFYHWNSTPSQTSQSATGLIAGNYNVSVTDVNSCTDVAYVTINNPSQVITTATGDALLCLGDSTNISATAGGGAGNYFFYWNMGLGIGNAHTVSPLSDVEYIVIAYDQNGCPGIPDTTIIDVLSLFAQNVEMFVTSPVCPGTATQISVSVTANHPYNALNYTWNEGLGPGPGPFNTVPLQETTYYVTVNSTICPYTVIDSIRLHFTPPPIVQFIPDITQGCMPVTVNFVDSSYSQYDDINSWLWTFGDGTFSTEQNPTHTFNSPDTFYVSLQVTTNGGCVNSSVSNPYPIYVFEVPNASFTLNATTIYLPNDPAICTNTSTGAISYLWDFGDGSTTIQENPIHNYMALGNYTITLIATNMYYCKDTTSAEIKATGDIVFPNVFTPDIHSASGGYYNPADYTNHVFFPFATGIEKFHMLIFNRWGELIFESNDIDIGWDGYYRGELCQQDVYVYKAEATFIDGRKVNKVGDIMLLR